MTAGVWRDPRILWTTIAALLLTGFQGWLGGRVVAHELAAWIVTVHMIVALVIVQMLLYVTVKTHTGTRDPGPGTRQGARVAIALLIVVTLIQIALGTQVRGGVDAALDAGVARDSALATVGSYDLLHRDAAIVVMFGAALLAWFMRTGWSYVVVALAASQIALGALMTYVSLLPAAQVLHLTVASLLLGAETVLLLLSWRDAP